VLAFSVINILLCRTKIIYSKNYFNLEVQKTEVYNAAYVQHYYCDVYISKLHKSPIICDSIIHFEKLADKYIK